MARAARSRQTMRSGNPGVSRKAASSMGKAITITAARQAKTGVLRANMKYGKARQEALRIFVRPGSPLNSSQAPKPENQRGANSTAKLAKARGKRRPSEDAKIE